MIDVTQSTRVVVDSSRKSTLLFADILIPGSWWRQSSRIVQTCQMLGSPRREDKGPSSEHSKRGGWPCPCLRLSAPHWAVCPNPAAKVVFFKVSLQFPQGKEGFGMQAAPHCSPSWLSWRSFWLARARHSCHQQASGPACSQRKGCFSSCWQLREAAWAAQEVGCRCRPCSPSLCREEPGVACLWPQTPGSFYCSRIGWAPSETLLSLPFGDQQLAPLSPVPWGPWGLASRILEIQTAQLLCPCLLQSHFSAFSCVCSYSQHPLSPHVGVSTWPPAAGKLGGMTMIPRSSSSVLRAFLAAVPHPWRPRVRGSCCCRHTLE
ncbi:uncharacterized protein LOC132540386 isoform X2 [Erinaceus europaeus]|nr:uncharacterized protein LOC132540386 isoform X2 [Erinaceus europaeus]